MALKLILSSGLRSCWHGRCASLHAAHGFATGEQQDVPGIGSGSMKAGQLGHQVIGTEGLDGALLTLVRNDSPPPLCQQWQSPQAPLYSCYGFNQAKHNNNHVAKFSVIAKDEERVFSTGSMALKAISKTTANDDASAASCDAVPAAAPGAAPGASPAAAPAAVTGATGGSSPLGRKVINIVDFDLDGDVAGTTKLSLANQGNFDKILRRLLGPIGLKVFKGDNDLIQEFDRLKDGGYYFFYPMSAAGLVQAVRQQLSHIITGDEEEFGQALHKYASISLLSTDSAELKAMSKTAAIDDASAASSDATPAAAPGAAPAAVIGATGASIPCGRKGIFIVDFNLNGDVVDSYELPVVDQDDLLDIIHSQPGTVGLRPFKGEDKVIRTFDLLENGGYYFFFPTSGAGLMKAVRQQLSHITIGDEVEFGQALCKHASSR